MRAWNARAVAACAMGWAGVYGAALAEEGAARPERPVEEAPAADTVVITASRLPGETRPTWQAIQRSTVLDMKDILVQQPGLSVSGGSGASQQWYVRGLGENELTFTVDGAGQSTQVFHHQSRFMFDPALLKTIQIDKGAGAASAGIGVTGGAIRMTTVDATDLLAEGQTVGARVSLGAHSNEGWSGSLAGYGRVGAFDALLVVNRVDDRAYDDGDGQSVPYSAVQQDAYLAKLGWTLADGHRLVLSQRREAQQGARPLRLNVLGLAGLPPFDSDLTQTTTNLEYEGADLGFLTQVRANVFDMQVDDQRNAAGPMPTTGFASLLPARSRAELHSSGANLELASDWGDHRLLYGYNLRREEIRNPGATVGRGREDKTDQGVYVEGIWSFEPVTLTTGLRYDRYRMTNTSSQQAEDGVWNPSLAAVWAVSPRLDLTARAAQASRSPRLHEAYVLGLPWGDTYRLADDIKPERAFSRELGLDWHDGPLSATATVFKQTIRDYLGSRYDAATDITTQANIGRLESPGYELAVAWQQDGLALRLGTTYSEPRVNGRYEQSTLDNVPTGRQWLSAVSYRFAAPRVTVSWRGRYQQRLSVPLYDDTTGAVSGHDAKPGYGVHDVSITWQPLATDVLNLNLAIQNVGNKRYLSQTNFCYTNQTACLPEPGRDVRLSANYKF